MATLSLKTWRFAIRAPEENVLENISFLARPGQTTAFIGSTGSGKSTIVNLVPRFFDVTAGSIEVDGVDIREVSQQELRHKIGYVPQKGVLFSGTIESNLRYADADADWHQLKQAAEIAQASEFINAKPEGYDAPIAQGGTNVSGGQKQRLSIARALVRNPEIYIFERFVLRAGLQDRCGAAQSPQRAVPADRQHGAVGRAANFVDHACRSDCCAG